MRVRCEIARNIWRQELGAESLCVFRIDGRENLSRARSAVEALGRADWLIVSWRTDQSNSFRVVGYAAI